MARPRRGGPSSLPFGVPRGPSGTRGRLAGVPRSLPAGARIGIPRLPVGPPPTPSRPSAAPPRGYAALAAQKAAISESKRRGASIRQLAEIGILDLDEEEIAALEYVEPQARKRRRPPTVLQGLFRALSVGENVGAGVAKGVQKELKKKGTGIAEQARVAAGFAVGTLPGGFVAGERVIKKKNDHALPPWTYVQALGRGFSEVPGAVKEGYTYEQLLKENNNPNSFLYKHSRPIGLSMAIAWDPTTYLGIGTATSAKTIAVHQLDELFELSKVDGLSRIEKGAINPRTNQKYLPHEWGEAMADAHVAAGRPHTMGDVLDEMRKYGIGRPRGGVKIAGAPLPGTERAGRALARRTRRGLEAAYRFDPYKGVANALVPDAAAKHIADDMLRSSALVRLQRMRDAGRVPQQVMEDLPSVLLREAHLADPATGKLTKQRLTDALSFEDMVAMKGLPLNAMSPAQKVLANRLRVAEQGAIRKYTAAKPLDKEARTKLELHLEDLKQKYDPVQATARFQAKVQGDIAWKQLRDNLLDDPRFAYPLATKSRTGLQVAKAEGRDIHPKYGYTEVKRGNKRYAVVTGIGDAINIMDNPAWRRGALETGLRWANKPQDLWKIYATQPNPSYHVMNLVGAMWNNALMGNITGMDYARAWGTLMASRTAGALERGGKARLAGAERAVGGVFGIKPELAEAREMVRQGQAHGGLGRSSQIFAEAEGFGRAGAPDWGGAAAMGMGPKGLERIVSPADLRGKRGAKLRTALRRTRQVGAVAGIPATGGLSAMALAPEAAKVGKHVGGTIEDWVRLTPFQKYATDPNLRRFKEQMLEAYGPVRVPGMQHPGFTKQQQQSMYEIGAAMTRHFQFDYTHLTEFERRFAKTIFPFWTFYSRNLALQAAQAVKQPGKYAVTGDALNFVNNEGIPDGPFKSILPLYFDQLSAVQIPVPGTVRSKLGLPEGQPIYLNPKLPFATLNMIPNLWIPFTDESPQPSWYKWNRAFSPIFAQWGPYSTWGAKTMFETIIGRNLGLAKPLDYQRATSNDFRQSTLPAPAWTKFLPKPVQNWMGVFKDKRKGEYRMPATSSYLLDTMTNPFITNYGDVLANPGKDPEKQGKINADRISWLTGIRIMPADISALGRAYAYGIKNELEAKKSELNERGQELPEEDEYALDDIKDAIDSFEYSREVREEEIYGPDER